MSWISEKNKATIRKPYAEIDNGDLDSVEELWSADHVFHTPGGPAMDATAHRQLLQVYQGACLSSRRGLARAKKLHES